MNKLKTPLLIAIIAMFCSAPAAQAACAQWDVSGKWQVRQSNVNGSVNFEVQQDGSELRGKAYVVSTNTNGEKGAVALNGTLRGNKIYIEVNWEFIELDSGALIIQKGIYTGKIGPQGQLSGTTFDLEDSRSKASFSRKKAFKCIDVAIEEPPGPPPIKLGKVPIPDVVLDNPLDICGYARSARKRGSPAAPGLERQCREAGGVP